MASIGLEMQLIPAGKFTMGSDDGNSDEKPPHEVTISRDFYLGKYEVTQGEWTKVMKTSPWKGEPFVEIGDRYPATNVTWLDAVKFCNALSKLEGLPEYYVINEDTVTIRDPKGTGDRLPTEAEWEYAARGGMSTKYSFGDSEQPLGDYAWYTKNADDVGQKYAHEVGQKQPNPFGLVRL